MSTVRKLFGTDGIRGKSNQYPMTLEVSRRLAKALVSKFNLMPYGKSSTVFIGKDTRLSGDIFEHALAAEFASCGVNVQLIGVVPTPAVSILTKKFKANLGIMVSASHNPFCDNGIKIFNHNGLKLSDIEEADIEDRMYSSAILANVASPEKIGRITWAGSLIKDYVDKVKSSFVFNNVNLKVVIDTANGALSGIAAEVFKDFGFSVVSICDTPNGVNINDKCGVTAPEQLKNAVLQSKADFGIAFDGDGDRVMLVDELGHIIDGNQLLASLTVSDSGCTELVSTIMANYGFEKYLASNNIKLTRTEVGDRYISEYMQSHSGVSLGGEPSGHIIIREHSLTGDGLFAGLFCIHKMLESGKKCSEFFHLFDRTPTLQRNICVKDKGILNQENIQGLIQECELRLKGNGRLIVRPSGTEPLIRVAIECDDAIESFEIMQAITACIEKAS